MKRVFIKTIGIIVIGMIMLTGCVFQTDNTQQETQNSNASDLHPEESPYFNITSDTKIELSGSSLTVDSGILLSVSSLNENTSDSDGINATFIADNETLIGDIFCDSQSTVSLELKNNSTLKGAINSANTAKTVSLSLDANSIWTVTQDSYITSLTDDDQTLSNIHDDGNTVYYDASSLANEWLGGNTYMLPNGGQLTPAN